MSFRHLESVNCILYLVEVSPSDSVQTTQVPGCSTAIMVRLSSLALSSAFYSATTAYTTFESQCSLPNATVSFVSAPDARGSLDIAWSCWATLIASAYSVVHLNVRRRSYHRMQRGSSVHFPFAWLEASMWCIGTLLAPEFLYGFAIADLLSAKRQRDLLCKFLFANNAPELAAGWKLAHMFYANAGGFALLHRPPASSEPSKESSLPQPGSSVSISPPVQELKQTERDAEKDLPAPVKLRGLENELIVAVDYWRYHLNAQALRECIERGLLSARAVPEDDIKDSSSYDGFTRLIILLQLTQFFASGECLGEGRNVCWMLADRSLNQSLLELLKDFRSRLPKMPSVHLRHAPV